MIGTPPRLPVGYRLDHRTIVGSTNDEAKILARGGAPTGTLVWADGQTAGRGRRGRNWVSAPGNLYLSLIQRPSGTPARAAQLGFIAAIAVADALPAASRLKWPNDVLLDGRKLSGILLESETGLAGSLDFVVIGIGINILSAPTSVEFPATCLAEAGITNVIPADLLETLVAHFDTWLRRWGHDGFAPIRSAWLARANGLGDMIRVRLDRETLEGRFLDLDENGALVLETRMGMRHITAGAVFPAT
ncbi:MAG: biotin--[acetyl-CoA-carboxylase] ligase [Alphaproteobacteria bacterium]|nr:biotin--[acetyl-CoA-carboxylase] ligase [Alphaproteobacteria bacterium]